MHDMGVYRDLQNKRLVPVKVVAAVKEARASQNEKQTLPGKACGCFT